MSEQPMGNSDLEDEFRQLTANLRKAIQAAWESPGRHLLQADLEAGLESMRQGLDQMAQDFEQSDAGAQLKSGLEDLGRRVQSGELEEKTRQELLRVLRQANAELGKLADRLGPTGPDVHPPDSGGSRPPAD